MKRPLLKFVLLLCVAATAHASNLDLSTVPTRDTVQLTIYNSEDLTLVRETRKITFKKGANPLQFSWANTLIDPTSVELKFLTSADKLEVLDTTFPYDKPQVLYWNVKSDVDVEATVQITYFTSGITWSADYVCVAGKDERLVNVEGFVRVTNRSGEEYENAEVRLVVGTINLVERIAQLASIPVSEVSRLSKDKLAGLRRDVAQKAMAVDEIIPVASPAPSTQPPRPKEIVKEGLSEYFIYTVEGTENIPNGWSKRMRSIEAHDVPMRIQYRYRPQEYGDQLVRMYLLTNNVESKLGTSPLPDGTVRVFRDNGRDGLSYLTTQHVKYIPIGDKIELNLGVDPEVIFELQKRRLFRDELWLRLDGVDVLRRVDDGAARIDANSSVVGWNEHQIFDQRIRNYSAKPIDVEVRRPFDGHAIFRSSLNPVLHDYRNVQFQTSVPAGGKADLVYELVTCQGRNAKQNNVTLENADVKP